MVPALLVRSSSQVPQPRSTQSPSTCCRTKSNDITLSLLSRAKASGFTTLVVTLDTPILGWRPHDIGHAFNPFLHGVGCQIGFTDPVFMAKYGQKPVSHDDAPAFPYDHKKINAAIKAGDQDAILRAKLGADWVNESTSGYFRTWEDLKFLREHWEGPIVLKGIQAVGVSRWYF